MSIQTLSRPRSGPRFLSTRRHRPRTATYPHSHSAHCCHDPQLAGRADPRRSIRAGLSQSVSAAFSAPPSFRAPSPTRSCAAKACFVGQPALSAQIRLARQYPDRGRRQILLDLIESRGDKGKWFAAAKDEGFLDIALECAGTHGSDPSTSVRAARDFGEAEPRFAASVALMFVKHSMGR